jgi:hypothetical protein
MFEGKPVAYTIVKLLILLKNKRLGSKGLPWTNTSLFRTFVNYTPKKFYNTGLSDVLAGKTRWSMILLLAASLFIIIVVLVKIEIHKRSFNLLVSFSIKTL